jgi:hypothetical protein
MSAHDTREIIMCHFDAAHFNCSGAAYFPLPRRFGHRTSDAMAPKGRKRSLNNVAAVAAPPPPQLPTTHLTLNVDIFSAFAHMLDEILAAHKFRSVKEKFALEQNEGGTVAPFKVSDFKKSFKDGGNSYTCGFNIFHLDLKHVPIPGVPLRKPAIDEMCATRFKDTVCLAPSGLLFSAALQGLFPNVL